MLKKRFGVLGLFSIFCIIGHLFASEDKFHWGNVAMGGGGFVSAIIASHVDKDLFYVRTDVGGAYRWDESKKKWISIMDWVDVTERGLLGVEAIAVDPKVSGKVYMVAGTSYWNEGRSAFLRSKNKGKNWDVIYTWDKTGDKGSAISKFGAHGNGMGRGNGEALAIDPNNPDIMFYGSRNKGLFKSSDNGNTWKHVDAFTTASGSDTTWNGAGFSFVTFAPGKSKILYAGFLRENDNVFQSTDGGETWKAISAPENLMTTAGGTRIRLMPQRAVVTKDNSVLIATFSDGAGPHTQAWSEGWGMILDGFGRGAVLKYDPATSVWTDISPEDFIDNGETGTSKYDNVDVAAKTYEYISPYGGITINPANSLEMVVTTEGYRGTQYWYDKEEKKWNDRWGTNIYYTNDGGASWVPSFKYYWIDGGSYPTTEQMDENGIGWMFNSSIHWSGSVAIDPFNTKRVWTTSGNGVFVTEDITAFTKDTAKSPPAITQKTVWKVISHGIEETVPIEVVSIPNGPMISVVADYDGFRHDDVTKFPKFRHKTDVNGKYIPLGSTFGLAYAPKAGILVKSANARTAEPHKDSKVPISPIQFSSDTGKTWKVATNESGISPDYDKTVSLAISTDGSVTLWTPARNKNVSGNYPVQRYENSSWTEVSGINGAYVVGDPENADVFYAYLKKEGDFFKSTDKGKTFVKAGTPGKSDFKKFRLAPNRTGDIWVPISEDGLTRSTDGGTSFNKITDVTYCEAVGFGKEASGKKYPAIYIFGTVNSVTGVFQSIDEGKSWVRVNDDEHEFGGLANGEFVVGDMNTFGVVYMSTAGRGIAVRLPGATNIGSIKKGAGLFKRLSNVHLNGAILSIAAEKNNPLIIKIFSLRGQLVYSKMVSSTVSFNLTSVVKASGSYILNVNSRKNKLLLSKFSVIK